MVKSLVLRLGWILAFANIAICHAASDWPINSDWSAYFRNTMHIEEPHTALLQAIKYFTEEQKKPGFAIDLGCGAGRDTLFLLKEGWRVFATDASSEAIDIVMKRVPKDKLGSLTVSASPFSETVFPDQLDLVNANRSLPFCPPEDFPALWKNIVDRLVIGGRFTGQFFGDRDEWASIPGRSHQTYQEVMKLLEDHFEIEYFVKEESRFPTAGGKMKYWHIFNVVAKKVR
jgi:tellurite methyltransferase